MTMTDDRPLLRTPTGEAVTQPTRPAQWHGYPYVWAWNVSLGATARSFIERECKTAAEAAAPPDAVYKARDDDPSMPGAWITLGMIADAQFQQRVREYAQALIDWREALSAYRPAAPVQPLQTKQHEDTATAPALNEGRGVRLLKSPQPQQS